MKLENNKYKTVTTKTIHRFIQQIVNVLILNREGETATKTQTRLEI